MDVMLHLFLEVISFSFSLLELLQKRKKSALDQEMKFSRIVSSSAAGPVGLAHHRDVFVNRVKHTEDTGEDTSGHILMFAS